MKNINKKLLIVVLLLGIFLFPLASAVCTVTLDKTIYAPTETVTVDMVCDNPQEISQEYTLNFTYQNDTSVELDTGTTPSIRNQHFYESFTIQSGWPANVFINATLQGIQLEGTDSANVSGATTNSLLITNASVGGKYLGLTTSVQAVVKDDNLKKISGGSCRFSVWSNDETTMLYSDTTSLFDGNLKFEWALNYESFDESKDYAVLLHCYCGSTGSSSECIDEDGAAVTNSIGTAKEAFTTNSWITINENPLPITYQNGTNYTNALSYAGFSEEVFYRANTTNNYGGSLQIKNKAFLVNNVTGSIFVEHDEFGLLESQVYGVGEGDTSMIVEFGISKHAITGVYYIKNFFDIYHNNLLVAQGIMDTETFNVTGTDDSFAIENVATGKFNYYTGEYLHICANITNNYDKRVEFEVLYNYRCGTSGSNFDTDRSLLEEYYELRAISPGISQYQCASLYIPYEDHLLYKTSQCYASVTIKSDYIETFDNKISTTSPQFNVTDYGMYPEYEIDPTYPIVRLFPDWRRFDDLIDNVSRSYFRAKINITKLNETWLDPEDNVGDANWDVYASFSDKMPCSTDIYNYTVEYANGTAIDNPLENKAITWKKNENGERIEHKCSIGIEDVNFSDPLDDYFIVKVWYEDFMERQTKALEGINNKTGTFHLDVDCPSQGLIGEDMSCAITAQVEDSQIVQKEVDFTCQIMDNGNIYSSINFNQMVTQTPVTINRNFPVPPSFIEDNQYTLQCYADYYNFGSRRDSFYDTFVAKNVLEFSGRDAGHYEGPGITGDSVDDLFDRGKDRDKPGPIDFKGKWLKLLLFFILVIVVALALIFIFEKTKKKKNSSFRIKWENVLTMVISLIILFFVII